MKNQIVWIIVGIVVVGCLIWVFAIQPATETTQPTTETPTEGEPTTSSSEDVGKMTDDIYVEIMARNFYEGEKDPQTWALKEGWDKLLDEYNVTQEQYDAYVNKLDEDPAHAVDLQERIGVRLEELKTGTVKSPSPESTETKTPVEQYYEKAAAVEPASAKAKEAHEILLPIFKKVFGEEVKLSEDMEQWIIYVFNRKVVADDITAVRTELENAGFEIASASGKEMTVKQTGKMWVITFWLDNEEKAGAEITL